MEKGEIEKASSEIENKTEKSENKSKSQTNKDKKTDAVGELNPVLNVGASSLDGKQTKQKAEKNEKETEKKTNKDVKTQGAGKKVKLRHIKLAYRLDGADAKRDTFRVRNYLSEESYKRLRDDTYEKFSGRCALCGASVDKKNATIMEIYKPAVETDKSGMEVKKLKLVGTELLCRLCYTIKMVDINEMESNDNYRKGVINAVKRIVENANEKDIVEHLKSEDRKRKERQAEYPVVSLKWLSENGYVNSKSESNRD